MMPPALEPQVAANQLWCKLQCRLPLSKHFSRRITSIALAAEMVQDAFPGVMCTFMVWMMCDMAMKAAVAEKYMRVFLIIFDEDGKGFQSMATDAYVDEVKRSPLNRYGHGDRAKAAGKFRDFWVQKGARLWEDGGPWEEAGDLPQYMCNRTRAQRKRGDVQPQLVAGVAREGGGGETGDAVAQSAPASTPPAAEENGKKRREAAADRALGALDAAWTGEPQEASPADADQSKKRQRGGLPWCRCLRRRRAHGTP